MLAIDKSTTDDLDNLEAHPFANLFPLMEATALAELSADIAANGLVQPIVRYQSKILDGRNRYAAIRAAGLALDPAWVKTFYGGDEEALAYVIATNLRRRHLSQSQRALVAAGLTNLGHGGARTAKRDGITYDHAAEALSVSKFLVRQAKKIRRSGAAHIVEMVERGEITISTADLVARLPAEEQTQLKSASDVEDRAAELRKAVGRFGKYTTLRLVDLISEATAEAHTRVDTEGFAREIGADALAKIDGAIDRLAELRAAVEREHAAAA